MKSRFRSLLLLLFISFFLSSLWANSPVDFYEKGFNSFLDADYFTALDYYKQSLFINPDYTDALKGMAETYFLLQEYGEALKYANQARKGSHQRIDIINLQGRIYLGLGELESAREMFDLVLSKEPHNRDAAYGIAEISVFQGNYSEGASLFEKSLAVNPDSRRALLSLVLLFKEAGELDKAEYYLKKALDVYPQDALVLKQSISFYNSQERWQEAIELARKWEALDGTSSEVLVYMGILNKNLGDFDEAVFFFKESLRFDQENPMLWFYLGQAYEGQGQYDLALLSYKTVNIISPTDGVNRITMENLLMAHYELDSPERREAARYHFDEGLRYQSQFLFTQAHQEFRRGRLLAPLDLSGWWLYTQNLNAQGYDDRYESELDALKRSGFSNANFLSLYELLREGKKQRLDLLWEAPRVEKSDPVVISLFIDSNRSSLYHEGSGEKLSRYMADILEKNRGLAIGSLASVTAGSEAYQMSRQDESDFYALLSISEMERTIQIHCELYLSRTGSPISSFTILRSGNRRIEDSLYKSADQLDRMIPLKSYIMGVDKDKVLIALGSDRGLLVEDELLLIRSDGGVWSDSEPFVEYKRDDLLGMVIVNEVYDDFAIGVLDRYSPFDLVNPGDDLYRKPSDYEFEDAIDKPIDEELKTQLLRLY